MIKQFNKKILYSAIIIITISLIIHFTYYLLQIPNNNDEKDKLTKTDAIIVLTGDKYRISENTFQNSRETYFWARDLNLNSLLVVTSNYHIPRVKLEFSRFFYEDNLYYKSVNITDDDNSNLSIEMIKKYLLEYTKYLRTSLSLLIEI